MSSITASVDVSLEPSKPLHPTLEDAITPCTGRFHPQTPTPSTPDLCWDDTPEFSTLGAPGDEYDSDGGVPVDISPSIGRRNRSKLRASLDLDITPSKEFRKPRAFDDKPLPITRITALIEESATSVLTETVSLHLLQDERTSEDIDDEPLPKEETTQIDGQSFFQTAPTSQEDAVKHEEKSHISDHQISNGPEEIISPKDSCDNGLDSVILELDQEHPSETTPAEIAVSELDVDSTSCAAEAACTPVATESPMKPLATWEPSPSLCRALPSDFIGRLRAEPVYCISTTTKSKRCRNKNWAQLNLEKVDTLLSGLLGSSLPMKASSIIPLIENLAIQAMCKRVHFKVVKAEMAVLKEYSEVRDPKDDTKDAPEVAESYRISHDGALRQWLQDLLGAHIPGVESQNSIELQVCAEVSALPTNSGSGVKMEGIPEPPPLFTKDQVALEVDNGAEMPATPARACVEVKMDINSEASAFISESEVSLQTDIIAEMPPTDTAHDLELKMNVKSGIDASSTQPPIRWETGMSAEVIVNHTQSHLSVEMEVGAEILLTSTKPQVEVRTDTIVKVPPSPTQLRVKDDLDGKAGSASTPFKTKHERTVDEDTPTKRLRYRGTRQRKLGRPQGDPSQVSAFGSLISVNWAAKKMRNEPTLPWSPEYTTLSAHLRYKFEPYRLRGTRQNISDTELIRYWLERPLTRTDVDQEGYIYVFWHPGNFGFLKIGRTKDSDINKRLRSWQNQCKIEVKQVIDQDLAIQSPVLHPIRIEQLIHAELHKYRLKEPKCIGCSKKHVEWFQADRALALRVVKKWSHVPSLYEGGRLSKALTEVEIKELCQVTTVEKIPSTPPKPSRRSLGKHSLVKYPLINPFSIGEDGAMEAPVWMKPLAT